MRRIFVPCGIVEGGGQLTDSPGPRFRSQERILGIKHRQLAVLVQNENWRWLILIECMANRCEYRSVRLRCLLPQISR